MLRNPPETQHRVWVNHFQILRNLLKSTKMGIRNPFYFGNVVHFCKTGCATRKKIGRDLMFVIRDWLDGEKRGVAENKRA